MIFSYNTETSEKSHLDLLKPFSSCVFLMMREANHHILPPAYLMNCQSFLKLLTIFLQEKAEKDLSSGAVCSCSNNLTWTGRGAGAAQHTWPVSRARRYQPYSQGHNKTRIQSLRLRQLAYLKAGKPVWFYATIFFYTGGKIRHLWVC